VATFHVEHIVAKQHGGSDDLSNLAIACMHCNLFKGPNIAGLDPQTGQLTPIFNPRRDVWTEHFALRGPTIVGLTPVGRTTVYVLALNSRQQIDLRTALRSQGLYP
jgi:hypothetical protein